MIRRAIIPMLFLSFIAAMLVVVGGAHAEEGIHIISSDGKPVCFPYFVKNISPKLAEHAVSQVELQKVLPELDLSVEQQREGNTSRVAYPSSVLEELKKAIEVLPQAARGRNGNELYPQQLNGKTIYVNSKVRVALSEAGLLSGDAPRDSAMLFQLLDAAYTYKIYPLCNVYAHKIAKRINQSIYNQLPHLKRDPYWKQWSSEEIFHKAVEDALISIEESLAQYHGGFPNMNCTKNQQWIEKYVRMFLNGVKKEYTFADFMGLHGQANWRNGRIDLRNTGLTSLEGLELITNPANITEIDVSDNELLTIELIKSRELRNGTTVEVDINSQRLMYAFSRLSHLRELNLSNNKITDLPEKLFLHNPLQSLYLDNNQLSNLPEEMCKGFKQLREISFIGNPMSEEAIANIYQHLPSLMQQDSGSEKKKKNEKKDKGMGKRKEKSKSAYR